MSNTIFIGSIFFKYEDDMLIQLRLIRIKNSDCYVFEDENKNKVRLTQEQLKEFTLLTPDGYVMFCNVTMDSGMNDVIVTYVRNKDIKNGNTLPYAVCRQSVVDVFSNITNRSSVQCIGCSVNQDNCPVDVKFEMFVSCNSIEQCKSVAYYIGDSLDTILYYLNQQSHSDVYDRVLYDIYAAAQNSEMGKLFEGYNKSLKDLLTSNNFMFDVLKANNIYQIEYDLSNDDMYNDETHQTLITEFVSYLENIIKAKMLHHVVIKYDKDINIDSIEKDHIVISDSNNDIYIIAYTNGGYENKAYETMDDKRDIEVLDKIIDSKN